MHAKLLCTALLGCVVFLSGCWHDTRSVAASFDGFRHMATLRGGGDVLHAAGEVYLTPRELPRTLAVVKVRAVSRYGDHAGLVETVELSEIEIRELARLGVRTVGVDAQPLSRLLPAGTRVQEEQLLAAARQLDAEALLVVTYDTVQGNDMWVFPLLFTVGLAPTVQKTCACTVHGIIVLTGGGGLVFDGAGSDDGWQIANGYTAQSAAEQVVARAERRAFSRLIDRIIAGQNGPDVRVRPESLMSGD
ncbi:MAG: hypothetical protein KF699_07310 [Phycisphaeraceae bacterium]|nr:hypothetical protein [Phycisphaeraceae bacterium]MBX3405163.1 hypothetical protein [Phycisphaeraceae bacterium]